MNDHEANEMLRRLSEHFHQPVMPVSRYCDALETWMRQVVALNRDPQTPEWSHGHRYFTILSNIATDIRKSNLLWRLIYAGEPLRTEPCPKHQGRWSGILPCEHGCDSTGWLPAGSPPGATG